MKGLDKGEFDAMADIVAGWVPNAKQRPDGPLGRLKKRGLVTEMTVSCGAYDCVGHQVLTMTSVGVMVWNAVKCGGG